MLSSYSFIEPAEWTMTLITIQNELLFIIFMICVCAQVECSTVYTACWVLTYCCVSDGDGSTTGSNSSLSDRKMQGKLSPPVNTITYTVSALLYLHYIVNSRWSRPSVWRRVSETHFVSSIKYRLTFSNRRLYLWGKRLAFLSDVGKWTVTTMAKYTTTKNGVPHWDVFHGLICSFLCPSLHVRNLRS